MADFSKSSPSKNIVNRTWITDIHNRLNQLMDFLNRPRDTRKSYMDPHEQVFAHSRPLLAADPDLLKSFFDPPETPDAGAVRKSRYKSDEYDRLLFEQMLRNLVRQSGKDKSSPMTQGQVLGGGYDE